MAILSTLALMDEGRKTTIYNQIEKFNTKINNQGLSDAYEKWYGEKIGKYPQNYDNLLCSQRESYDCIQKNKKLYKRSPGDERIYDDINDMYEMKCLYHDLKRDFGFFDNVIDFSGLVRPFFVEPSINNERLRAQDGFFLFEPYKNQTDIKKIHDDVVNKLSIDGTEEGVKIKIPAEFKDQILTELDYYCGINKAKLFPDSENVASYISNEFSNTSNR